MRVLIRRLYPLRERLPIELTRRGTLNSRGAEQDAQQKIKMVHTELAMKKVSRAIKTSIQYFFRTHSSHERELIHTGTGKILCQAQLRGTRYLLSMFLLFHSFDGLTLHQKTDVAEENTRKEEADKERKGFAGNLSSAYVKHEVLHSLSLCQEALQTEPVLLRVSCVMLCVVCVALCHVRA